METTPPEVITAFKLSVLFWLLAVLIPLAAARRWHRLAGFADCMLAQWKPALGISLVYAASNMLRDASGGWFGALVGGVMTFCQALLGLGLARSIASHEPLPVTGAIARRQHIVRSLILMAAFALLAVLAAVVAGALGQGIARLLGEIKQPSEGSSTSMPGLGHLFFYFLAGAGIAEETVYRLVIVPLVWKFSGQRWLAVLVSGILFGAYHLTPLSGMYLTFWQYLLTQFFGSALIGIVWAVLYLKRGYETAVLAHTLSDWLPAAIFVLFMQ